MITARKRIYMVLLGVSALGLAIDRFVIPRGAEGASSALPVAAAPPQPDPLVQSVSIPGVPFPENIVSADPGRPIIDLFAPPALRGRGGTDNQEGTDAVPLPGAPSPADTFVTQHKLSAVLIDARLKIAVVDGHWVRVGETIDGCTLIGIEGQTVHFSCVDKDTSLTVGE